jgi:signal transduction histidine kinase
VTTQRAGETSVEFRLELAHRRIEELEALERTHQHVSSVLARLASLADHDPSAVVEIELDGTVSYRNNAARDMFPDLDSLGFAHPLLNGVSQMTERMKRGGLESLTREILVDYRVYSQKVVLTPDYPQISVYTDDVTEQKNLLDAFEMASSQAELLASENALLAEVGRIITSSLDIDDVYEGFAQQVRRLIPFDRIAISLVDLETETFVNEYVLGVFAAGRERGSTVPLEGTMVGAAVESRDAIILQGNLEELTQRFPGMVRSGLKSVIAAPIMFQNEVLGVLNMRSLKDNAYEEHHLDLMRKVVSQIAPAIANSQLYAENAAAASAAQRLARQNAALAEIGRVISSSLDIEEVYALFADQTFHLIPFDRISINLIREDIGEFMTAYVIGTPARGRAVGETTRIAGTFTEQVIRNRHATVFHPGSKEAMLGRFPGLGPEYESGIRSFLSVPLIFNDRVMAVLSFRSLSEDTYTHQDVEVAQFIGAQVAGAIANSQLHAETVEADRILQEQAAELTRSNAELEQFAYVASHDLQEPLRVIAGYVHLLEERYGDRIDQDGREFIAFTTDAVHRMRMLINDLLDYSRVESDGNPFEHVDCNRALSNALADLGVSIQETGAEITSDPLPEFSGDPVQISLLLENLIANAIKFRQDDESPKVHVSCHRNDTNWQLSVSDNGIGIRPRYQDRIFGMFKRAHKRSKYPGTGIGLAMCSKIVERHGGTIWVESEVGEGSTFHFTIPAVQED